MAHKIRYGDEKGACENIFSYGFLEDSVTSAKTIFLDLDISIDDLLRPAKMAVNTAAPGFRISDKDGHVDWESDFVWLLAINEEDGLDFKLKQTIDGQTEIEAFWKDQGLDDTSKLRSYLEDDPLWDVYCLRVVVLLLNRIETQLKTLREFNMPGRGPSIRAGPWELAGRLHNLELELLKKAKAEFEDQVSHISTQTSHVVLAAGPSLPSGAYPPPNETSIP
jgi:hypothetical protein